MILICPKCKSKLYHSDNSLKCDNNHSFDISKEGYVNLLMSQKSGDKTGDSRASAHARHSFLSKGYYACLKDEISSRMRGIVLDICCGEGYYDTYPGILYGFDISKEMVRLAKKSNKNGNYFVANLSHIPVENESIDTAIHLFAPFNENEFFRVLKNDGALYSVIPGSEHLWEMKKIIYDVPYKNDEETPKTKLFSLVSKTKVTKKVTIDESELKDLFSMTPYYYRTSRKNRERLDGVGKIQLTVDFVILEYRKQCLLRPE